MKKRHIIRLQLILLAVIVLLLIVRTWAGPPAPDGLVVLADLEPGELAQASFELDQPAGVRMEGTGSFETAIDERDPRPALAAYGWILRRADREVVWQMTSTSVRPGRGTLAQVVDSAQFDAGTYDVYFTSYGNAFGHTTRSFVQQLVQSTWRDDADRWALAVQPLQRTAAHAYVVEDVAAETLAPQTATTIWSSAPMREGRQETTHLFEVTRPVMLDVYGSGELPEMDYGWIEDAVAGQRVWIMTMENTEPAGGAGANRMARVHLQLEPSIYRAVYRTDPAHHYGHWRANPPLDPAAWGLTLSVLRPEDATAVQRFDPWTMRTPLLSITEVPNNTERSATFTVTEPLTVVAYAVGELGSGDNRYDYGWITRSPSQEEVWKMSREVSWPAGGHENNRVEMAFLQLQPGTYTMHYQTDGSHAFGNWSNGAPESPERWGLTLFPLRASAPSDVIQNVQTDAAVEVRTSEMDAPAPPPPPAHPDRVVVQMAPLGNEVRRDERFEVGEAAPYRIYALGEISMSGRYDYGWIEQAETGETVWEMTWQNTQPAGGHDRNRRFNGTVHLEPGTYILHFRTDFSHAYNDFGHEMPADPERWGITLERADP